MHSPPVLPFVGEHPTPHHTLGMLIGLQYPPTLWPSLIQQQNHGIDAGPSKSYSLSSDITSHSRCKAVVRPNMDLSTNSGKIQRVHSEDDNYLLFKNLM